MPGTAFGMHIIVVGDPVNGFKYYGPFKTGIDAVKWVESQDSIDAPWWPVPLLEPTKD